MFCSYIWMLQTPSNKKSWVRCIKTWPIKKSQISNPVTTLPTECLKQSIDCCWHTKWKKSNSCNRRRLNLLYSISSQVRVTISSVSYKNPPKYYSSINTEELRLLITFLFSIMCDFKCMMLCALLFLHR